MTTTGTPISVITPLSTAFEWMKIVLFRPFNIEKWFAVGFCAWLALLGQGGGGGGGSVPNVNSGKSNRQMRQSFEQAKEWVMSNLDWIIPAVSGLIILGIVIGLVITWLSSRGQFMFLYCVAGNRAEVRLPWSIYAAHGNSLFLFRFIFGMIAFVIMIVLLGSLAWIIYSLTQAETVTAPGIVAAVLLGLMALAAGICFGIVAKLTQDFVVPIMYLGTTQCLNAWRVLLSLLSVHWAHILLYLLFQLLIQFAIGMGIFAVVLLTCCTAGCLLSIPFIGTVLLLPIHVFVRSYSLFYLTQFGLEFNVFKAALDHTEATPGEAEPV